MRKQQEPKGNFVWIDLEMTGLNPDTDYIMEIATIITDDQLNEIAIGPVLTIHQPDEILANMTPWVRELHARTGLLKASQESTITVEQAEHQTLEFIKQYCKPDTAMLAGSSIWQDRSFMRHYMPRIIEYLYYKQIDISTIKVLVGRWYPEDPNAKMEKKEAHRALADIQESIDGLRHLRKYFFK